MHGGDPLPESFCYTSSEMNNDRFFVEDGRVFCPPKEMGGCGGYELELKCLLPEYWISSLKERTEEVMRRCKAMKAVLEPTFHIGEGACWEHSEYNSLYSPDSKDVLNEEELLHFRRHWTKGEPVIVKNVLEQTSGLSWEPMVMWRALSECTDEEFSTRSSDVKAIDCLAGCEVISHLSSNNCIGDISYLLIFNFVLCRWRSIHTNSSKVTPMGDNMQISGLRC